jgi:hypothetical protein
LAILGRAQLTKDGTATLKLTLGVGTYQVKAVFRGTPHGDLPAAASASAIKRLKVSPKSGDLKATAVQSVRPK